MPERLRELLEAERSGVMALRGMLQGAGPEERDLLVTVLDGERESCRLLGRDILRSGRSTGGGVGGFHLKVLALPTTPERLALLVKGQEWVVRRIDAALPLFQGDVLSDLEHIRAVHLENISLCRSRL